MARIVLSEARVLRVLTPIVLGLLAFGVRSLSWPSVWVSERVQLPSTDGYYHLRRIVYALVNAPETLGFDRFLNFPHGARAIWPPFLDAAIAWGLAPFVGTGAGVDVAEVERLVVWLPPLLGSCAVVATYAWMRRHFGFGLAVGVAGLLCVLSGSAWYARIGMLDHHVAVALLGTLLIGAGMDLLRAVSSGTRVVGRAGLIGGLFALLLHVWPGGMLHVLLLELCFVVFWLARDDSDQAVRFGWAFGMMQGVACVLLLAAGWPPPGEWGNYASTVLSRFQPLFFGCGAAVVFGSTAVWQRSSAAPTRALRGAQALGLGLAAAAATLLVLPELREGIVDAWTWLGRGERFQGSVLESRPLFVADGELDLRLARARLSDFVFVFPVAWLVLVVRELRGPRRAEFLLLAGVAAGLAVATLMQARFFNSFAVPLAVFFALSLQAAYRWLSPRSGRLVAAASLGVIGLWLLLPSAGAYRLDLSNQLAVLRGEERAHSREARYWEALFDTAAWLRDHTPSPGDAYDPDVEPSFGVLGHWQYGHLLQYVAERPAVVGNFGDDVGDGANYQRAFDYFKTTEARAADKLGRLSVRYVVIRPADVARGDYGPGSMIRRMAEPNARALARHRLIYERRVLRGEGEMPRSHFRIFERVAGAVVAGSAPAGSVVEARLGYVSPTGRRGEFRRTATTGDEGRYQVRVAYSTRGAPAGLDLDAAWQVGLDGSGQSHAVPIPEAAVQEGSTVAGPNLVAGAGSDGR